jgi:hypothetical protein
VSNAAGVERVQPLGERIDNLLQRNVHGAIRAENCFFVSFSKLLSCNGSSGLPNLIAQWCLGCQMRLRSATESFVR